MVGSDRVVQTEFSLGPGVGDIKGGILALDTKPLSVGLNNEDDEDLLSVG